MHHNLQKHMVHKIYVQFYCVMINLINFKHVAQNKIGLDISISKFSLSNMIRNLSNLNFLHVNLVLSIRENGTGHVKMSQVRNSDLEVE